MIRWRLKELLRAHGITPYRLAQASGLSRNTAYRLADGEPPARVELETLRALITALRELTDQAITPADLLSYEEQNRAGRHHHANDRPVTRAKTPA